MHPDYQGTGIGKAICAWLKSYEQPVYLDCWNGNEYYRAYIRKMAVIGLAYFRKLIMKYAYFVSKKGIVAEISVMVPFRCKRRRKSKQVS